MMTVIKTVLMCILCLSLTINYMFYSGLFRTSEPSQQQAEMDWAAVYNEGVHHSKR